MIPNEGKEGRPYLAAKKLSALQRGITSKHDADFFYLNCLHSFRTKNKLKSHEKVCKNKDFCGIAVPSEKINILEFNQYMKSDRMPYIIYADLESLIEKIDGCANIPEKSSTTKLGEYIPCEYSMSTIWVFSNIENKHILHRGEDCMKKSWTEHAENNVTVNKKKELRSHQDAKVCYICGKIIFQKLANSKSYQKVTDHCHYTDKYGGATYGICNLRFNVLSEILVVFHNGSNYDYHFIIKKLTNKFERKLESSVPIERKLQKSIKMV